MNVTELSTTSFISETSEFSSSASAMDSASEEFHWCRHYLPTSVLALSTTITILLSFQMINIMWGATCRFKRSQVRRIFYPTERKVGFLQYGLFMPMFEIFVVWGSWLGLSIDSSTASIVIAWIVVNMICLLVLTCACRATSNFRMMVHIAQCFRLPMAIIFFCDRIFNSVVGVESAFIVAMFICSLFEFFHVQDYFAVVSNSRLDIGGVKIGGFHLTDEETDDGTNGPISPMTAEENKARTDLIRLSFMNAENKRQMAENHKNDAERSVLSQMATDDDDEAESHTELEDNLPADVRAGLNDQAMNATIVDLLREVMKINESTEAERVKRMVLRFKNKLTRDRSGPASGSTTGRDSEF
jgi:hypothetical protein